MVCANGERGLIRLWLCVSVRGRGTKPAGKIIKPKHNKSEKL